MPSLQLHWQPTLVVQDPHFLSTFIQAPPACLKYRRHQHRGPSCGETLVEIPWILLAGVDSLGCFHKPLEGDVAVAALAAILPFQVRDVANVEGVVGSHPLSRRTIRAWI